MGVRSSLACSCASPSLTTFPRLFCQKMRSGLSSLKGAHASGWLPSAQMRQTMQVAHLDHARSCAGSQHSSFAPVACLVDIEVDLTRNRVKLNSRKLWIHSAPFSHWTPHMNIPARSSIPKRPKCAVGAPRLQHSHVKHRTGDGVPSRRNGYGIKDFNAVIVPIIPS